MEEEHLVVEEHPVEEEHLVVEEHPVEEEHLVVEEHPAVDVVVEEAAEVVHKQPIPWESGRRMNQLAAPGIIPLLRVPRDPFLGTSLLSSFSVCILLMKFGTY